MVEVVEKVLIVVREVVVVKMAVTDWGGRSNSFLNNGGSTIMNENGGSSDYDSVVVMEMVYSCNSRVRSGEGGYSLRWSETIIIIPNIFQPLLPPHLKKKKYSVREPVKEKWSILDVMQ